MQANEPGLRNPSGVAALKDCWNAAQAELRAPGPCGKHPRACLKNISTEPHGEQCECTVCAELAQVREQTSGIVKRNAELAELVVKLEEQVAAVQRAVEEGEKK
jgi:hypothetical protein